jgi:hypothetical protein
MDCKNLQFSQEEAIDFQRGFQFGNFVDDLIELLDYHRLKSAPRL